ncbi:putative K domain-containing protein [Helianthus annuus]|uniref:K domain-containing protein n=1 Tax=Helianthus annuus TaxID=4232 RepID=A0A251UY11_HELAN|nr:RNA-binding KH domain-containing protein RCF3 [Helianthus annuus]KAF5810182.1 putative K domain-containing protein [Helianthus annuus]KAJ0581054.1 putative K domain-containing protein [Helianthus annuus]KAJ0596999.1 putative K domain-containing protein [Helianthus annuus]KAJ0757680.1 putative K domain-containing protein [Helianthus annuus]KAJ0761366.1 putative K domain-containing protein [Helianthus annuus]
MMDRSRSKRYYYDQDYDHMDSFPRTKQRYNYNNSHHYGPNNNHNHHHQQPQRRSIAGGRKVQDPSSLMVTTSYRILCHDAKAGSVIGKSGSIIKAIRQHTGAWINVHELIPGDEERIIEISDTRRRDPDGRMPNFSPAQEALLLIHERILESDGGMGGYGGMGDEEEEVYMGSRMVSRLVVSRMHVGCLLGKGGKIIEQMRMETKTHIRVLPRDHTIPRCVDMSEEIVQVVGDMVSVKNAIEIISSRLRESQHRDRSHFQNRMQSPDRFFPPEDDFMHHPNNIIRRQSMDGNNYGPRLSGGLNNSRSFSQGSRPSGYVNDTAADNAQSLYAEDLVFRILCPSSKVDSVIGQSDGFMELLQNEIGVEVRVADRVAGSDEQIIIISSEEGPDDDLFPAQEALLHIQTRILDLVPEKENFITTRLLLSAGEIACLDARDGFLAETKKMTGADIQILPRDNLPQFVSVNDELVQIVGEIRAAREALVELTLRLRSYIFQGLFQKDGQPSPFLAPSPVGSASNFEAASSNNPTSTVASSQTTAAPIPAKNNGGSNSEAVNQTETGSCDDAPGATNRIAVPLVTRSILEVVIPEYAVPKLITKSRNKLAQISELSGANVKLVDTSPEAMEHIIQISGTPEQAERAQSLLQGFILSTQEDGP